MLPYKAPTKSPRRGRSQVTQDASPVMPNPGLPYLALTQTSIKIRSEFRGWWMEAHLIPLCELDRYFSTFFPTLPRDSVDQQRLSSFFKDSGSLRIWVRANELKTIDILRLLKFKLRFPDYKIVLEHPPSVEADVIAGLSTLVNNKHPKWLQWLRGNIITQARLKPCRTGGHVFHFVVKVDWAENWMRPCLTRRIPDGFLSTLGLDGIAHWTFDFTVCYS